MRPEIINTKRLRLAKPFNIIIAIHVIAINSLTELVAKWGLLEESTCKIVFFFLINPFLEEVEWRGIFWLTRNHSSKIWWKISFLISCFLFALIHPRGIGWILGPFAIAITGGIIIARTKRFWPVFVNHALVNATIILLSVVN